MASNHRIDLPGRESSAAPAGSWSPRNRLFFLIGATTATWTIVALLIGAWG